MIEIPSGSPSPTITGCTIGNGKAMRGIIADNHASAQITNNTFTGFSDAAVYLNSEQTVTVTGNTFKNNGVGVHVYYFDSTNLTLTGNTYTDNSEADVRFDGHLELQTAVVWNESPGTIYKIVNGLGFRGTGSLTIANGIIVKMTANGVISLNSGSYLDAVGTTFTWADGVNEWSHISFAPPDARSKLENCIFEHAKGSSPFEAVVYLNGANSSGPTITGCTFGNGTAMHGINAQSGTSPQITNNTFTGFSDSAVYLHSTQAMVNSNTFNNNAVGVHIYYVSNAPTVTSNTYYGSTDADVKVAGGISKSAAWNESPGTVYRVDPETPAFSISEGGRLTITEGITVKVDPAVVFWVQTTGALVATGVRFTATDPGDQWKGISLNSLDQSKSRLENCIIEYAKGTNNSALIDTAWGASATGSPTITGCTIGNGNALRGIYVSNMSPSITKNSISGFSDCGICVRSSYSPLIAGNTITGNRIGIDLLTTKNGVYRVNKIQGNSEYGISNGTASSYPVADARYNWWGNSTGPTTAGNPLGTGDRITAKVNYFPWAGSIADTDGDGMWDEWEVLQFTNLAVASAGSDHDDDGLLDKDEFLYGTDPKGVDSDGDVDGMDLSGLIAEYGRTGCSSCKYDLDTDGDVDIADLFLFSEDFGRSP
jgi:parallel beta-helix repeat protein